MIKRKLFISDGLGLNPEQVVLMGDFCNFCADHFPITGGFKVFVVDDRELHDIPTTAAYHRGRNIIKVYGKNRALVDILRSIAHELTHMQQMIENRITFPVQDVGGEIEDEANSKAGEIIKSFAQSEEKRKRIYESKNRIKDRSR